PDCAEIMWNEHNWTLVSMPVTSTRAEWDEGLRTVRQYNDLLRVLPPAPKAIRQSTARRNGAPGRPVAPPAEPPQDRREQQPPPEAVRRPPQTRAGRAGPRSYQP
ncbi:MAG: hypothetical protein JO191_08920, partial [Mycobacteriaceae bacterium]|nr:hypothetical protein [Mycobacteriaceae bacterium]